MVERRQEDIMKVLGWATVVVVVLVGLLLVGILAGHVGGIAIRKQGAEADPLQLQLSEPVLRGVPVVVRWTFQGEEASETVMFTWRDSKDEYSLGEAALSTQEATLVFPCQGLDASGSLVVRSAATEKVVGSRTVELSAAGPECI